MRTSAPQEFVDLGEARRKPRLFVVGGDDEAEERFQEGRLRGADPGPGSMRRRRPECRPRSEAWRPAARSRGGATRPCVEDGAAEGPCARRAETVRRRPERPPKAAAGAAAPPPARAPPWAAAGGAAPPSRPARARRR